MKKEQLNQILLSFYNAIEENRGFGINWEGYNYVRNFPSECCDIFSEILKKYLEEIQGMKLKYIMCSFYDSLKETEREHIFLESSDFLIDITASQFNNRVDLPNFGKIVIEENKEKYFFYNCKNSDEYHEKFILYPDYLEYYNQLLIFLGKQ